MDAAELLRAGEIDQARSAVVEQVRRTPQDPGARMFLWQLLAVCGEWDKAAVQLRALAQLSPAAEMLSLVYGQAIAAEKQRQAAFEGQGAFAVLMGQGGWLDELAAALGAFAAGRAEEGHARRAAAFDAAPDTPGQLDERAFSWIADADGRFGPAFEIVVNGRWGLVPFEAVSEIAFEGARDLRDLVWAPALVSFRAGRSAAALLPARYPGSAEGEAMVRLARTTLWREGASGEEGFGQRLWSLDGEDEAGILSARRLSLQ